MPVGEADLPVGDLWSLEALSVTHHGFLAQSMRHMVETLSVLLSLCLSMTLCSTMSSYEWAFHGFYIVT